MQLWGTASLGKLQTAHEAILS